MEVFRLLSVDTAIDPRIVAVSFVLLVAAGMTTGIVHHVGRNSRERLAKKTQERSSRRGSR